MGGNIEMTNMYRCCLVITMANMFEYVDVDFSRVGKVKVKKQRYVEDMLEAAPEEFAGEAATPAVAHLVVTNPEATKFGSGQAKTFHHLAAKALFMRKRAQLYPTRC